jgi:ketopantoate reductase
MDIDKLERAAAAIKEYRAVETAVLLLQNAIAHEAKIWNIQAEDAAESERSIPLEFTKEESAAIYQAAIDAISPRLLAAKAKIEAA